MYERTYGSRYEETKDLDIAQVAKLVRKDIRVARAAGDLGEVPEGVKFSVRIDRFAGGESMDITVVDAPDEWVWTKADESTRERTLSDRMLSPALKGMAKVLRAILARYNFDGSEVQVDYFDVRFYTNVSLEDGLMI